MLGASSEADYEPISSGSGTAVVYDLSGLSFSPQIKVEGDTDEDALIRKLRDLEPEFIDFIIEANPDLSDVLIFEGGEAVRIPIVETVETPETLPPWRR